MADEDKPLGSCCARLADELSKHYDHRYVFERDGMLAITAGYTEATETHGGHWTRVFAHYCPFCAARIMPESARLKAN